MFETPGTVPSAPGPTKPLRVFAADHEPIRRLAEAEGLTPAELVHAALERYRRGPAAGAPAAPPQVGPAQLEEGSGPRELLLVVAAAEEWALPLASIREVVPYTEPRSVGDGLGVALVRGDVVPVRDLSAAFGPPTEPGPQARIVVANGVGLVVEGVRGVATVAPEDRGAPPAGAAAWVAAVLRVAGRIVLELEPERAF